MCSEKIADVITAPWGIDAIDEMLNSRAESQRKSSPMPLVRNELGGGIGPGVRVSMLLIT